MARFRSRAPRPHPRLLLAVALSLIGIAPSLLADSPFLRTSADLGKATTKTPDSSANNADPDAPAVLALGPRTVTVAPGANAILELAIDHLNRIVTPFERPSVRTVSELSTEVEGPVVYVATASEAPATLYISAGDASRTTIALTLAPRRVPPREIRLQVTGYQAAQTTATSRTAADTDSTLAPAPLPSGHPARWQQPLPYLQTLTTALRDLARGEAPEGFRRRSVRSDERIRCDAAGLKVSALMVHESPHLRLVRARLRYRGDQPLAIRPHHCRPRGEAVIAAQATWPRNALRKGEETQLLLALRPEGSAVPISAAALQKGTRRPEARR